MSAFQDNYLKRLLSSNEVSPQKPQLKKLRNMEPPARLEILKCPPSIVYPTLRPPWTFDPKMHVSFGPPIPPHVLTPCREYLNDHSDPDRYISQFDRHWAITNAVPFQASNKPPVEEKKKIEKTPPKKQTKIIRFTNALCEPLTITVLDD